MMKLLLIKFSLSSVSSAFLDSQIVQLDVFSNVSIFFIILYILIPYLVCNSTLRRRTQSIFSDVLDKVVSPVRTDVSARRQC
jgi:hypothetical protein